MRLPANGIPKFDGIDDLRRMVRAPERVLDDVEQERVSQLAEHLYDVGEDMPFEYSSRRLASALVSADRISSPDQVRRREQVRAAWDVRFRTDPTDQAAIGARIGELLDGAPATIQSQRGVAELRTLVFLSTDEHIVPTGLGITTVDELDSRVQHLLADPLVSSGRFGPIGLEFLSSWQRVRNPQQLAAWRTAIDDAARGRGVLPADISLDQLMSPATRWTERSKAQRMRLLDALASIDGTTVPVRDRLTNPRSFLIRHSADLRSHVGLQVKRAMTGEAPLPRGILVRDIIESWHYRRAPYAQQVDVLRQQSKAAEQAVFQEYEGLRRHLDAAALEVGRFQAGRWIDHALRTSSQPPAWVTAGDVLVAGITERQKATLLAPYADFSVASTPAAAAAGLVDSRLRLLAEPLGGSVPGVLELRRQTQQLIDRNVGRIAGTVDDGYGGHPDYAEVGRISSNLDLLAEFQAAAGRVPAAATTGTLQW